MRIWEVVTGKTADIVSAFSGKDPRQAPKYFVLSLHRSGTRSVTELFENLGLRAMHWPVRNNGVRLQPKIEGHETDLDYVLDVIEPVINKNDATTDVPIPVLYRELDKRYPNARFLLLRRRPAEWIRSVRKHIGERRFNPYERVQYWHYFPRKPAALGELSDSDLAEMCERHFSQVSNYFAKSCTKKFACFDLENLNTGMGIAAFLGSDSKAVLPHVKDVSKY